MKTLSVIKSIIPVLANIQGAGRFSNPLVATVPSWVDALANAANEEKIDLTQALNAMETMAAVETFEEQQDEISTVLAILDQLLEDIPAGNVREFVAPPEGFRTVRMRLSTHIEQALKEFRPSKTTLEKMRKDAAQLAALSMGEEIDEEGRIAAQVIYDLIDNSIDSNQFEVHRNMIAARSHMERIAI